MSVITYQSFFPVQCLQRATRYMSWISVESLWVDHGWLVFSIVFHSTRNLTSAFLPWVCSRIQRRRLATVSFLFLLYPFRSFFKNFLFLDVIRLESRISRCSRAQGSVSRSRMISWLVNCLELFLYHIASDCYKLQFGAESVMRVATEIDCEKEYILYNLCSLVLCCLPSSFAACPFVPCVYLFDFVCICVWNRDTPPSNKMAQVQL